jgi:Regulator of chromosome condensation (RCC1) repeat
VLENPENRVFIGSVRAQNQLVIFTCSSRRQIYSKFERKLLAVTPLNLLRVAHCFTYKHKHLHKSSYEDMEDIQLSPSSKRSGDGCQIMACGDDEYACLGLPLADDDEDRSSISPTLINPLPNLLSVRAMAAGGTHSVA